MFGSIGIVLVIQDIDDPLTITNMLMVLLGSFQKTVNLIVHFLFLLLDELPIALHPGFQLSVIETHKPEQLDAGRKSHIHWSAPPVRKLPEA